MSTTAAPAASDTDDQPAHPTSASVVLPAGSTADLFTAAERLYARTDLVAERLDAVYPVTTRPWRTRRLLEVTGDRPHLYCAGGPIGLLKLRQLRNRAQHAAHQRWMAWHQAVSDTPAVRPWSAYGGRHTAQPDRYSLAQARTDYQTQPRLIAMAAYNAHPAHAGLRLDLDEIDLYQAGWRTYLTVHMLSTLPGDGLLGLHGRWMSPATTAPADRLAFLAAANRHLDGLGDHQILVRAQLAD